MAYFPLFLNLKNKDVLIIGSGDTAYQEVSRFLAFEARITVLGNDDRQDLKTIAATFPKQIRVISKEPTMENIQAVDCTPTLVLCTMPDSNLNSQVYAYFAKKNILVEDFTSSARCDFIFPAIVKRGDVVCGISSSGKSPHVSQFIKSLIESSIPEKISDINEHMNEIRRAVRQSISDPTKRTRTLEIIFTRLIEDDNQTSDAEIDGIIGDAEL